ncbi:MAG: hypothetical protein J6W51_10405 [Fibrobacter sp.]|nr:hypothetical protein [Fibrobacter sp.]
MVIIVVVIVIFGSRLVPEPKRSPNL